MVLGEMTSLVLHESDSSAFATLFLNSFSSETTWVRSERPNHPTTLNSVLTAAM